MATHLHLNGVPLRAVQRITGHATLAALERYLDVSGREAAEHHQSVLNALFPATGNAEQYESYTEGNMVAALATHR